MTERAARKPRAGSAIGMEFVVAGGGEAAVRVMWAGLCWSWSSQRRLLIVLVLVPASTAFANTGFHRDQIASERARR